MQSSLFAVSHTIERIELPDAQLCYYQDWLPDHHAFYQQLAEQLQWRQDSISAYGQQRLIPRLNAWYGDAHTHYSYSGIRLQPCPWTDTLTRLRGRVAATAGARFNSVLANWYRDGNDSVAWHSDDEPELGPRPVIASLSLGVSRLFELRHRRQSGLRYRLELAGGSLLIMAGSMQQYWQHRLPKTRHPAAGRINLTFRWIEHN